ncbi:hypothetical protein TRICI_002466 [Trichomonascus ciferrii]|uniref:AP180 N-terminal homology (ANTH) domain-containing protein n=1 Tax=Trichomonascus ciferrii TaxID=44093 RepID=A0A642V5T9_9ASCO|nr:hypothetical protein TRICI_002466 [Trichomonascus ciferrii]
MIREGCRDVALEHLASNSRILQVRNDGALSNPQAIALSRYSRYLYTRAVQFGKTKVDYVRFENKNGGGRLKDLTVEKGLLRECDSVYQQIEALLKCKFHEEDVNNDIVLTAFRLLVSDLLSLYQTFNEGVINLLEHYFEMSKHDASHALDIYEGFTKQTANVVAYLKIAKHLEHATKLRVPNIKHAPTSLMDSLADYLNDPDFETNHRQYLAEKEAKKGLANKSNQQQQQKAGGDDFFFDHAAAEQQKRPPQPANDLVDIFGGAPVQQQESVIGNNQQQQQQQRHVSMYNPFYQQQPQIQQPVQPQAQPQPQVAVAAQYNQQQQQPLIQQTYTGQYTTQAPLQQTYTGGPEQQQPILTQNYTGAGFGGYTPGPATTANDQYQQWQQPQQQQQPVQLQRSNTGGNPFQKPAGLQHSATGSGEHNPFKRASTLPALSETSTVSTIQPSQPVANNTMNNQVSLQRTGTNPFSRQQMQPLSQQDTGTNPFRKSMYATSTPSMQRQPSMPASFGGLEALPTVSVFPQTQQMQQSQPQQQQQQPTGQFF